ncbi:DNA-processing protein DprA [Parablautia muri]|uniref:DNA-protecting protein DprA n=1 Tax=Parablautia muri TaxID=2320879 RepID=A0A9X5BG91_9FIRM|nr:DNA-processing protein DprA [Parablautia muri]NBJ93526.1 DNA-protecting protein DprA [Parablautia muri]
MTENKIYQYWMHNLPGIGDRTIEKLLKAYGSAKAVYFAEEDSLKKVFREDKIRKIKEFSRGWNPQKRYQELLRKGIAFYCLEDAAYPERLRRLSHPPYALYCMGSLPEEDSPCVAVIGARECSEYGRYVAQAFAGEMASAGISIVSGMARGIDGIGQKAALESGGATYAVLGSGVDIIYPLSNQRLYYEILDKGGGIISVFPPGTEPKKQHFPERNRIVAGLSDALLVVEARIKSGTWITVDMALEQGKNVYAVPGRLTDRLSDGCNLLIRQGAGIALSPKDMMAEFTILANRKGEKGKGAKGKEKKSETSYYNGLLSFLDFYPVSIDEILEKMKKAGEDIEITELLSKLVDLCMEGGAKQVGGTYFVKIADNCGG